MTEEEAAADGLKIVRYQQGGARIYYERDGTRDLEGKKPAEHLRDWWEMTFGIDHSDAKAKAERNREYRQTGNTEQDMAI